MAKLTTEQLDKALDHLPGWAEDGGAIRKLFQFEDFITAMSFVNRVAELAEMHGHHPDIDVRYNKVLLALVTHDQGGITALDTGLAGEIDELLG